MKRNQEDALWEESPLSFSFFWFLPFLSLTKSGGERERDCLNQGFLGLSRRNKESEVKREREGRKGCLIVSLSLVFLFAKESMASTTLLSNIHVFLPLLPPPPF